VLRKTISLPKGSKINAVNVSFSERQNLGKLYIPGFVPRPDMGGKSSFFVPLSDDIGAFLQNSTSTVWWNTVIGQMS